MCLESVSRDQCPLFYLIFIASLQGWVGTKYVIRNRSKAVSLKVTLAVKEKSRIPFLVKLSYASFIKSYLYK